MGGKTFFWEFTRNEFLFLNVPQCVFLSLNQLGDSTFSALFSNNLLARQNKSLNVFQTIHISTSSDFVVNQPLFPKQLFGNGGKEHTKLQQKYKLHIVRLFTCVDILLKCSKCVMCKPLLYICIHFLLDMTSMVLYIYILVSLYSTPYLTSYHACYVTIPVTARFCYQGWQS